MNLDIFVNYIYDNDDNNDNNNNDNDNNNNNNGKIIILKDDIELIQLQIYLCKIINNCYIFNNRHDNYYNNVVYQIYNDKIFCIIKQNKKSYYIWKIKK